MESLVVCSSCERRIDNLESGSAESLKKDKEAAGFDVRLSGCLQICGKQGVIDGINIELYGKPATVYLNDQGARKIKTY